MEKTKVLVVDDNSKKAKAIECVFDGMGLDVVRADSGNAALKLLLENEYAVVLLDVKMPGMDGYETAEIIRSLERTANTPIIFITAHAIDETDISKGYSLGVVDYVTSPISPEILRAKVAVFANLFNLRDQQRMIVENSTDGIVIISDEGITRFANPAAEHLFDRPALSLIGELFDFPTGKTGETDIHRKDKEPLVAEMGSVKIEWEGKPARLVSLHDITDRKKDEILLQKAKDELEERVEERVFELSTLYDLSKSIGWVVKFEDLFRLGVSSIGKVMDFDLVGVLHSTENSSEIAITRAAPVADSVVKDACEILIEKVNGAGGTVFGPDDYQLKIVDTFSKEKGLPLSKSPAFHVSAPLYVGEKLIGAMIVASTGENSYTEAQVRLFETIANEIGSAVHRLNSLIESEERRTRTIINSIREGVLFIDVDGKTTLSNPTAESVLELYALRQDREKDAVRQVVEKALALPGSHAEAEFEIAHRDLLRCYHLEATTVQGINGEISGTAVVIRDITNEREMERLRSSFLSSISHDLRTPLTVVMEYLAILLDGYRGGLSAEQIDCLQTASKNAERLQALIEDLLTVTRIDAHGFTVSRKDTRMSSIVDICVKSLLSKAKKKEINLEGDSLSSISVYVDQLRISQVLTNLIDNALKFTPEGGTVKVKTREQNDYLLVSVSDNGRGIPKTEIPRIFDLFYKVSTGDEYGTAGGTGLGLFISSEMVKAHGGRIWVESTLGEGTTFFFTLPISSRKAGLRAFLSDAVDHSVKHDLPLSILVLNHRKPNTDGTLLNKVQQNLGPEDHVIIYGSDLDNMVVAMFTEEKHMKQARDRLVSGISDDTVSAESLCFSKESRNLQMVLEEVLKKLSLVHQEV